MPTTATQDVYKITRLDTVHINPSIMEGEMLNHSMLGPDTAIQIARFPPAVVNVPFITGNTRIPNIMTCNEGVWTGSPSPFFSYQWYADGVLIPGATSRTLLTTASMDGVDLTCRVTGTSPIGSDEADSLPLGVSLVQALIAQEVDYGIVTGLSRDRNQDVMLNNNIILNGLWVDTRMDVMQATPSLIQGLPSDNRFDLFEQSAYILTEYPYYGSFAPLNNDGSLGTAHWTYFNGQGEESSYAELLTAPPGTNTTHDGRPTCFTRTPRNTISHAHSLNIYQDVPLPTGWLTDISNGILYLRGNFWRTSFGTAFTAIYQSGIQFRFKNSSGAVITDWYDSGKGTSHNGQWENCITDTVLIPTNATIVEVQGYMEATFTNVVRVGGINAIEFESFIEYQPS